MTSRNEHGTKNFAHDILMGLHDSEEGVYSSRECEGGNELCSSDDGGMPMDLPESSLLQKHLRARNGAAQIAMVNNKPPLSPFIRAGAMPHSQAMILQQHDPQAVHNMQNIQQVNQPIVSVEDQQFLQDLKQI